MDRFLIGDYQVRLKDQSGSLVAVFDNWTSLSYTKVLNGIGEYTFQISGSDERQILFELDGQIEVWRSISGSDWRIDYEGFHRKQERFTNDKGEKVFVSSGVSYEDLLSRTIIGYKEGTVRSNKSGHAETVMREFVRENCTSSGDQTAVGRLNYDDNLEELVYRSELPGLTVPPGDEIAPVWRGERAYENLLSTLQDIAATTGVDFRIVGTGNAQFSFMVYSNGYGVDRTLLDVDPNTGKNLHGNYPVVFSVDHGNISSIRYTLDNTKESNAVIVLGKGEGSTRDAYTVADAQAIARSPWNRREISRPGSNQEFDYQFRQIGDEALSSYARVESLDFVPLPSESYLYGVHYDLGDKVTAKYDEISMNKTITKVSVSVQNGEERIALEFSER